MTHFSNKHCCPNSKQINIQVQIPHINSEKLMPVGYILIIQTLFIKIAQNQLIQNSNEAQVPTLGGKKNIQKIPDHS